MNINELVLLLREKGVFNISDVEMAVLETNGELSVMLKTEQQPINPKNLGIPVEQEHGPTIVIMDGKILKKSLKDLGYSIKWLKDEVQKQGAKDISDVFLAQIDSKGIMYVDLYDENIKQSVAEERPLIGATLKKIQADLETYALETEDPKAKKMYSEQAKDLQKMLDKVLPYLK